jgi:hypothetical protein
LRHHISKYKSDDPEFVRKLLDSFYVDDLVSGEDTTSEARRRRRLLFSTLYKNFRTINKKKINQ